MNLPSTIQVEWTSVDAAALKEFLSSDVAKKAFSIVADACPELMDGGDVNKTLVRNGEVKGFSLAINTLFQLVVKQPELPAPPVAYPDLDDDTKWDDKQNTRTRP